MTTIAIHQPQYLPYLGFFHKIVNCDVFVILDSVQFHKGGLQNRNRIKTGQGWQWLTIPVLHRLGQLINEVVINPQIPWRRKHWNAIEMNYSRAPYFDLYSSGLEEILEKEWVSLNDLNIALIKWIVEVLEIKTQIEYSSSLGVDGSRTELLINICKTIGADCYLSGSGGRRYMDLDAFEDVGIEVTWQEFVSPIYDQRYPRVGFIPNLSIVDALFCCGPETRELLQQEGGILNTNEMPSIAKEDINLEEEL